MGLLWGVPRLFKFQRRHSVWIHRPEPTLAKHLIGRRAVHTLTSSLFHIVSVAIAACLHLSLPLFSFSSCCIYVLGPPTDVIRCAVVVISLFRR